MTNQSFGNNQQVPGENNLPDLVPLIDLTKFGPAQHYIVRRDALDCFASTGRLYCGCHPNTEELFGHIEGSWQDARRMACSRCCRALNSRCIAVECGCILCDRDDCKVRRGAFGCYVSRCFRPQEFNWSNTRRDNREEAVWQAAEVIIDTARQDPITLDQYKYPVASSKCGHTFNGDSLFKYVNDWATDNDRVPDCVPCPLCKRTMGHFFTRVGWSYPGSNGAKWHFDAAGRIAKLSTNRSTLFTGEWLM